MNLFANRDRDTEVENKHRDTNSGGEGRGRIGRLAPTVSLVKADNYREPTGRHQDCTQGPVVPRGKEIPNRQDICTCTHNWGTFLHSRNSHSIVKPLYVNTFFLKKRPGSRWKTRWCRGVFEQRSVRRRRVSLVQTLNRWNLRSFPSLRYFLPSFISLLTLPFSFLAPGHSCDFPVILNTPVLYYKGCLPPPPIQIEPQIPPL